MRGSSSLTSRKEERSLIALRFTKRRFGVVGLMIQLRADASARTTRRDTALHLCSGSEAGSYLLLCAAVPRTMTLRVIVTRRW